MSAKRERKSLDTALASEFVYGTQKPSHPVESELNPGQGENEKVENVEPKTETKKPRKPRNQQQQSAKPVVPPKGSLMSRLLENTIEKEATVRLTVDMPESMHRKLSILCAKTGRKKADIVRMLLDEALQDISD